MGQNAYFSLSASGPNISYQWQSSENAYGNWTNISGATSSNLSFSPVPPLETKFYRCHVNSTCENLTSAIVSLSYQSSPEIDRQTPPFQNKALGSSLTMMAYSDNGVDWTNINNWELAGDGQISWDNDKQAWKVVGEKWMYLKPSKAIPIDVNRTYSMSVEILRENNQYGSIYWGGQRLASDRSTVLSGIGGDFDYSCAYDTIPTAGYWTGLGQSTKTGTATTFTGWGDDNCAFYAVGGIVNYGGSSNQVTYIRNIEFYESNEGYYYQWKKNGTNIQYANRPEYKIQSITTQDEGTYTCLVSNIHESITSNPIVLKVKEAFASPELSDQNYIYVQELNKEAKSVNEFESLCFDEIKHRVQYFDGLGRLIQSNVIGGSPDGNDIVTPVSYDSYGREPVKYLPFKSTSSAGSYIASAIPTQWSFYQGTNYFPYDTANAKTVFESSPLNRILEQGAPGRTWQPSNESDTTSGHTVKYVYGSNGNHDVLLWKVVGDNLVNSGGTTYNSHHYYFANTLYRTIVKDENWKYQSSIDSLLHSSQEYKDFNGNVVLKRTFVKNGATIDTLNTYYVYDHFNLLRYVLPPKASKNFGTTITLTPDSARVKGLCYFYKYDARNRMIAKQLPGADSIIMVYDKRDRLVATQDGNQRAAGNWIFTKYDRFNRAILSGIYTNSATRATLQTEVNTFTGDNLFEVDGTTVHGYTNRAFPNVTDSLKYYTITYYDNYDFPGVRQFIDGSKISSYTDNQGNTHYFDLTNGLVTGTKVLVLEASTYITTTSYYDDRYRILESLKNLYGDSNGYEIVSNSYDFVGNPLQNRQTLSFNGSSTRIDRYYTYDHVGRLLKTESEINGSNRLTVSEMTYNELGQMTKKGLSKYSSSYLQEVDYSYNIRGWLSKINDPDNLGTDLFSMKLMYENPGTLTNLTKENQYNGNISGVIWNRKTDQNNTSKSAYSFRYDALNRIANNYYGEGSSLINSDKYREYDYSYDLNGNILALKRNKSTGATMDNLSYSYLNNLSNQIATVSDAASDTLGFYHRNTSGNDYLYDKNGNLAKDKNKLIDTITYNFLNLPKSITKNATNSITYYYDAMGTKLMQTTVLNGGTPASRYYLDGFEYLSNKSLSLIHMDEGVINHSSGNFTYEYFIKDHLGSTRVAFEPGENNTALLTQSTDNYPFGMSFSEQYNNSTNNKYLYNGKELQDETLAWVKLDWYDYGARFYDPAIGRWNVIDPKADKHQDYTPYAYVYNNPIGLIDPFGLDTFNINLDDRKTDRISVENSKSHTYKISSKGKVKSTQTLALNDKGLVEFPSSGEGFGRYGKEDEGGDHYLNPDAAAALFGLSAEMDDLAQNGDIDYGDMSDKEGKAPGGDHKTHGGEKGYSGDCIDVRYLDNNFQSFQGNVEDTRFSYNSNSVLLQRAGLWGFTKNYVSNKNVWNAPQYSGYVQAINGKKIDGHNDHLHLTFIRK